MAIKIIQKNKQAFFNYEIIEKLEAGLILKGTEIKSIRNGKVNIRDAYIQITKMYEIEAYNFQISPYEAQKNTYMNHSPLRKKKLLLHKKEIKKLYLKIKTQSLTLIPLKLYLKNNYAKLEIGLAKGKKLHDKRETIRKKEDSLKVDRLLKKYQ